MGNPKDRDGRVWMPTVEKPKLKHIQAISKGAASLAPNSWSIYSLQMNGVRATAPCPWKGNAK